MRDREGQKGYGGRKEIKKVRERERNTRIEVKERETNTRIEVKERQTN